MILVIKGKVLRGEQYGRKLGFPTVNLDRRQYSRLLQKPRLGVYSGTAKRLKTNKIYKAGIVIGPIDKKGLPKIEAYLLGFKGDLYGEKIELTLEKYLRPYKIFKSETELKKQIEEDVEKIKKQEAISKKQTNNNTQ